MTFHEIATFEVAHQKLPWPWIAFSAGRARFAFASSAGTIESRAVEGAALATGASFALPDGLELPRSGASPSERPSLDAGLHGFAVDATGTLLAVVGIAPGGSVLVTCSVAGELARSPIDALVGPGFGAEALAFDATGARLWLSVDGERESALVLVDARSHAVIGVSRFPAFPPPALHELHLHPRADAVLLLAACGQDGTFGRVAQYIDGAVVAIPSALDAPGEPAGLIGFSNDGENVFFAESDALRVRSWPSLAEVASRDFENDFISNYSGLLYEGRVFVDGDNVDEEEDAVLSFDAVSLKAEREEVAIVGEMWAGQLGADLLVTISPKGEPAKGRVYSARPERATGDA